MQAWISNNPDHFYQCITPIVRSWDINLELLFDHLEQVRGPLFTRDLIYLIEVFNDQYHLFSTTYVRELRRSHVFDP
jgi:hypothetical protein